MKNLLRPLRLTFTALAFAVFLTPPQPLAFAQAASASASPASTGGASVPGGIVLKSDWDSNVQESSLVVDELKALLSGVGQASRNLGPAPNIGIYRGVTYLMPLKEALKVLGIKTQVSSRNMVICPGFPHKSLNTYSFNQRSKGEPDELHVVTDMADRVVAIQLYWIKQDDHVQYYEKYHVYDFINSRSKASTAAMVGHSVRNRNGTIELVSVFKQPAMGRSAYDYGGSENTRKTELFMPQPLVDLILFRIQKIQTKYDRKK